jgi:hypothetical protein
MGYSRGYLCKMSAYTTAGKAKRRFFEVVVQRGNMPIITPEIKNGKILWSMNRLADEFEVDRRMIKRRLESAGVEPVDYRKGSPVYRLKDAAPAILSGMVIYAADADPDDYPPDQRAKHYDAELKKVELLKRNRELIPAEEYREEISSLLKSLVQFVDTLPELLARDCGLDPEKIDYMQKLCDEKREDLYQELIGDH